MSTFEVSPSQLHATADETAGTATDVDRAGRDLEAIDPGNPGFSLSSSISEVSAKWLQDVTAATKVATSLAERLHATATAYQQVEDANEANANQVNNALGGNATGNSATGNSATGSPRP